jgi:hypothetical protein
MAISQIFMTEDHDDSIQKNHWKQEAFFMLIYMKGMITELQRHPEDMNKSSRGRANSVHGMNSATVLISNSEVIVHY